MSAGHVSLQRHFLEEEHCLVEEVFVLTYRLPVLLDLTQPEGKCEYDLVVAVVSDHPSTRAPSSQSSIVPM